MATLHYASGDNIDSQGNFTPAQAGFNLADVSSVDQLNALPAGVKGLVWLDQGDGVTQSFIDAVKPYIGNPNVYGFFLKDEPDPTGQWNTLVTAANLKAESDWIHANVPGAKTFITMMNMGSSDNPSFANTYTPENTHIDLFGIDPYPVRSDSGTVDYSMIDKAVAAAEAAGIPHASIVPVFQTFGGGNWVTDSGGHYVMPTAAQEQQMLDHWAAAVPNPAFDYAYAWGSQNGDQALESSPALQNVFLQHNTSGNTTTTGSTPSDGSTLPVEPPSDSTTTPVDTSSGSPTTPVDTSNDGSTSPSNPSTPPVVSQPATTDPTTSPDTDVGNSRHDHHHRLDFSHLTDGNTSSWGGHHHRGSASQTASEAVSTATDTASTPPVASQPATADPTTSPDTDVGNSRHDHHHRLDFSHLTDGSTSSWGGHHHHGSAVAAAIAAVNTATDTIASGISDATLAPYLDQISLHGSHHSNHADHHSWHW
ncbi:calcium-binding protein [Tardiphaga robiniae]|uniref:calcium-binding protein n=1 Tax=Tardiphaga robiniae TaxID=943830 RepID=UPI000B11F3A5|nr:calcium-binding protein [Tardiphaga robiniae]